MAAHPVHVEILLMGKQAECLRRDVGQPGGKPGRLEGGRRKGDAEYEAINRLFGNAREQSRRELPGLRIENGASATTRNNRASR